MVGTPTTGAAARPDQARRDSSPNVPPGPAPPLPAIRGYVEALADGDASPEDSRRFLDVIGRQTRRMERLVGDLLRLARLGAGQETVGLTPCDTPKLAAGAVADLAAAPAPAGPRVAVA